MDGFPVEVCNCSGGKRTEWLTNLIVVYFSFFCFFKQAPNYQKLVKLVVLNMCFSDENHDVGNFS